MNNKGQYLVKKNVFKKGNPPLLTIKKRGVEYTTITICVFFFYEIIILINVTTSVTSSEPSSFTSAKAL